MTVHYGTISTCVCVCVCVCVLALNKHTTTKMAAPCDVRRVCRGENFHGSKFGARGRHAPNSPVKRRHLVTKAQIHDLHELRYFKSKGVVCKLATSPVQVLAPHNGNLYRHFVLSR